MTENHDLSAQLRAHRPTAPAALRNRVRQLTATETNPTVRRRGLGDLWRDRRPWLLAAPVALALVAAVAVGISQSGPEASSGFTNGLQDNAIPQSTPAPSVTTPSGAAPAQRGASGSSGAATTKQGLAVPGVKPQPGRQQTYTASLTVLVHGLAQLSQATAQALQIAQALGGYPDSVNYSSTLHPRADKPCPPIAYGASGVDTPTTSSSGVAVPPYCPVQEDRRAGVAQLVLRVPAGQVAAAMTRLSQLGTISDEQINVQDVGQQQGELAKQIQRVEDQIAELRSQLAKATTPLERNNLRDQLQQAEQQLAQLADQHAQTGQQVRYATLSLTVETPLLKSAHHVKQPVHHGRAHRALAKSWDIVVWELVAALYVLVVAVPLGLLALAAFLAGRVYKRRRDERLLAEH